MRSIRRQTTSRLWLVGIGVLAAAGGLGYRLYDLQVTQASTLQERAALQRERTVKSERPRAGIVDRRGVALALDEPIFDLYAHPFLIDAEAKLLASRQASRQKGVDREALEAKLAAQHRQALRSEMARTLAQATGQPAAEIAARLADNRRTVALARGLGENARERIVQAKLPGLEFGSRRRRFYPDGANSASLVGFLNYDGQGQGGVEQFYHKRLTGASASYPVTFGSGGLPLASTLPTEAFEGFEPGRLALTIDARVQRAARLALERGVEANRVTRGAAIVLEPQSGEILAMAVSPSFDNNRYGEFPPAHFKNWAVSDLYEPGSTFKPVNVALALSAGAIRPDTVVNDSGSMSFGRYMLSNYDRRARGAISVTKVLMVSSNIGMIRLMQKMPPTAYYDKLREIGIGGAGGVDLPGETRGIITNRTQFAKYPVQVATVAFGQGVALTPLQLASLHGAIANGGMAIQPHLVRAFENDEGQVLWKPEHRPNKRIFTPEATAAVREMMMHVVEEGTGKPAHIPGYRIGGKTGTAQKANIGGRGYLAGKKITSFVGYLPAHNPRYVVLVVLDEPKSGNAFGSTTAAPIVREICQELISYGNLPPSHPQELLASASTKKP
ncbi:MAG: penicillin-binding protein 2 [Aphanocapsa lilacina HA4352-LM1]|jgi:cell division protein FtsI (penicillin-binding protein 3)|nr:penicillin-binding protein 2 [Aphanocapsa lilacina HA4352-LM1]